MNAALRPAPSPVTHDIEEAPMGTSSTPTVARLDQTMWIPIMGSLVWLGPLWLLVVLGNTVAVWGFTRWGSLDQSLWMQAAAGWQRWPIAAVGFTVVSVFLPLFVTNGATRRRLGQSALLAMVVLVVGSTALIVAGFALEGLVFDSQDWTHAVDEGGRTIGDVGLPAIAVAYLCGLVAWFLGGWILAVGAYRYGWLGVVPGFVIGIIPIVVVEFLLFNALESTQFDVLDAADVPSLWIGVPVSIAVLVVAAIIAARATRSVEVE